MQRDGRVPRRRPRGLSSDKPSSSILFLQQSQTCILTFLPPHAKDLISLSFQNTNFSRYCVFRCDFHSLGKRARCECFVRNMKKGHASWTGGRRMLALTRQKYSYFTSHHFVALTDVWKRVLPKLKILHLKKCVFIGHILDFCLFVFVSTSPSINRYRRLQ